MEKNRPKTVLEKLIDFVLHNKELQDFCSFERIFVAAMIIEMENRKDLKEYYIPSSNFEDTLKRYRQQAARLLNDDTLITDILDSEI